MQIALPLAFLGLLVVGHFEQRGYWSGGLTIVGFGEKRAPIATRAVWLADHAVLQAMARLSSQRRQMNRLRKAQGVSADRKS